MSRVSVKYWKPNRIDLAQAQTEIQVPHSGCPDRDANTCEKLIFDKDAISVQWGKLDLARLKWIALLIHGVSILLNEFQIN